MANQTERAVIDLVINGQQAQTSLKDLTLAVGRARSELIKMKEADDPKLYAEKLEALHKLIDAQKDQTARINDTTTAWQKFKKEFVTLTAGVVGGNVITAGLQALWALIPDTLDRTLKLKDSFADIEKSTGMSTDAVKKFNKELKGLDTRTANSDLRDIAIAGGQLGVANEQLKDFVENTDKAVVALGDEFTGGVEQVAKELGGMAKLFDETKNQNIGKSINSIGSAINELGAAGAATGPEVAQFTLRIGQLGKLAPLISETMGLGAALQELGVTAEIGSSGLGQILLKSSQASALFAQQIGMTQKATEALINASPNEYLLKLAESFRGLSATQVAQRMKDLKIESEESIKVMSLLANETDLVREKQALAGKAMSEGTSLTNEFSKKNHQLARDLKDLQEWFNGLFTSEAVTDFVVSATHSAVQFVKVLPEVGEWLKKITDNFGWIAAASVVYYSATIKATAAVVANTIAEGYRKAAYELGYRWLIIQTAATEAYEIATLVLTGQISLQTAVVALARNAWAAFSAVLIANPIGIVVTALAGLAYAVKYFSETSERALAVEREIISGNQELQKVIKATTSVQQSINEKIGDYNNLSKAEQDNLEKTIQLKKTEAVARLAALQARARENALQNAGVTEWQKMMIGAKNTLTLSLGMGVKRDILKTEQENMRSAYDREMAGADQLQAQIDGFQKQIEQIDKIKNRKTSTGNSTSPDHITDPDKKDKKSQAQKDDAELEKLMAEARRDAMTAEGGAYEKSVAAFAQKYTRMYDLAKNDGAKINEIQRLSLLEWAGIEKQYNEDQIKEQERAQKEEEKLRTEEYQQALTMLEDYYQEALLETGDKMDLEKQFLEGKLLLEETYGQKTISTRQAIARNLEDIDNERERQGKAHTQHEKEQAQQRMRAAEMETKYRNDLFGASVSALKGFFSQSAGLQRAALIAEKAWAIAEIGIALAKQIAQINSVAIAIDAVTFGTGGSLYQVPAIIKASALAGAQVAAIAAQSFSAPAFVDGGFTDMRNPSGFYSSPTFFTDKQYTVAENGRPEFVISNPALQKPVVADFARMLDVAQRSGDYSMLSQSLAASGGSQAVQSQPVAGQLPAAPGMSDALLMQLLQETKASRAAMEGYASRPIENNYRQFEKYQQRIQEIRQSVSL